MTDITAIEYYWRPGCPFCMRLGRAIERAGIPTNQHNIWDDAEAAATVRSIANGNETVPTVVVGDAKMVNPSMDELIDALRTEAPALVPADADEKKGFFRR